MNSEAWNPESIVAPGSTIGIFGSGQLGKMIAMAAKQMGYRVHVFSPAKDSSAGQVADLEIQAAYTDLDAVESFAKHVDVVTIEFENIPVETLETAGRYTLCYPGIEALRTTQNRRLEKEFLLANEIPTPKFRVVTTLEELRQACDELLPAIIKTTANGYDGKGQAVIRSSADIEFAWESLKTDEAIVEELIDFEFEFSVVAARNSAGLFTAFPAIENEHENQILHVSFSPSSLTPELILEARNIACRILDTLGAVGVMSVEFFYRNGEILVNEIAPRPHNSGHLTIEAHATSQFEQHVRAICGLTFGSSRQLSAAAMVNLLGQQWDDGEPKWHFALTMSNVKLHLYCKGDPEINRKMGHMTATAGTTAEAREYVLEAKKLLGFSSLDKRRLDSHRDIGSSV